MELGEIKRTRLIHVLERLGGQVRHKGGEILIAFPGTTVTIGRRNFSRAMLKRVERKLVRAGLSHNDFFIALKSR